MWHKSSHSNPNGCCVEVDDGSKDVRVRDSKDTREDAPVLAFTPAAWNRFLAELSR
jgi:hypothetical protein